MNTPSAIRARRVLIDDTFTPATLHLADGTITRVAPFEDAASDVLDVPDSAVLLPGIVDSHVHLNEPGRTAWEGFLTGTAAAARGGVTTLIDMPLNSVPPTTSIAGLRAKQAATVRQLAVDVGLWGGAVPGNVGELEPLWEAGVFGFKCFLSPSGVEEFGHLAPADFDTALREVARLAALMIVHAEDPAVLDAAPHAGSRAYADFLASRPDEAEIAAIRRVLDGARATGARVHILHLSSARALDAIADARAEGLRVTVETCPHYLTFAAEQVPDAASQFKCCPPIRDSGNRDALWQALDEGLIDCIVTDHSPATAEEKDRGDGDLQQAWGGISGLQVGFATIASEARARGFGLERVVQWMARNTADLVGLSGKGRIAAGADADLVVYDPSPTWQVDVAELAHRNPISAYAGHRVVGRVVTTVLRGRVLDAAHPDHGWGRTLTRA